MRRPRPLHTVQQLLEGTEIGRRDGDLRLTTAAAEENLREAGIPARRREGARDAEAAAVILREFLSSRPEALDR